MKLNYRRTFFIGLAFLSICAFWQFYDNEIPKILKYNFGLGETLTGVIMALDNVLALFLLPFFGALSDKTNTKLGKRTPYILFGTISAMVLYFILIQVAKPSGSLIFFIIVDKLVLKSLIALRANIIHLFVILLC